MSSEFVTTLVADKLSSTLLKETAAVVEKLGGRNIRVGTLEDNKAAEIFCSDVAGEKIRAALALLAGTQKIDVIVQLVATRRKKLLVADLESTIIAQEILDEMAELIGLRDKVAAITHRGMAGELDFPASLRERTALFKGQPVSLLDKSARALTFSPGAEALVKTMKANGAQCWLVTGGFGYFVKPLVQRLGFDRYFCNELVLRDGVITGEVVEPILDKNSKKSLLQKACAELGLSLAETMAVGDGANDIPMLSACNEGGGLGVAYRAKPAVCAAVPHQINYGDLSALVYAQGYRS